MTATTRRLAALLGRTGLLAVVLAIAAGILGMHVLTGDHSAHGAGSHVPGHAAVGHPPGDHAHPATHHAAEESFTASGSCGSGCPGVHDAGVSCIPSAKAGALAVFPPQATAAAQLALEAGTRPPAAYSYIPTSPTPCELSISRT
ncbi:DUF6153 family protein [Pseudarthrobacter sp. NS4]|uniref:DUF6153 family protein n=1 Tax=Pseudarthrobacter sp. NS4 TaxID=2973976 RepID=UPI002162193E|nr:DUF6153 family protein [Pseudarthrobacter sp. NS4]